MAAASTDEIYERYLQKAISEINELGHEIGRAGDETHVPVLGSGHPLADENGDVWVSPVVENEEMVEMLEASRQYRNMVEAMSTAKQLMLETMRMK